jgi:biopolymer transport protein ExbB/TolQ
VFGIFGASRGVAMQKDAARALVASGLAEALVTTAAGLAVAIPAVWCRNHFCNRLEVSESEMSI